MAEPPKMELDDAFWQGFMRRPEVKAAYQSDKRLEQKRIAWAKEREAIREAGEQRQQIANALEAAPADIKKLIAPMFHIKVVERYLWMLLDECNKKGVPFVAKLRDDQTLEQITKMRESFHQGGEARMAELENEWYSTCSKIADDEEKKKELKPISIDVHNLKHILEFGQECRNEGNKRFKEGLYEEALMIYTQGDDMMKKYKVGAHLVNESKWFKDYHLTCLKNKAQAALKLELFSTALDAAQAALRIDEEDVKAWYRKAQAEKSLGKFDDAEASLKRLEDVAQWCADRRIILQDCETERKRIHAARVKHKLGTQEMLGKAFKAGIFSNDRDKAELEAAAKQEAERKEREEEIKRRPIAPSKKLERNVQLTAALAGDLMDELSEAYGEQRFQERVHSMAHASGYDGRLFLHRLKDIALEVQKPIITRWGFEGSEHGVREMSVAIRDVLDKDPANWLKEKQTKCLELLYGGNEFGGMAPLLLDNQGSQGGA